MPVTVQLPGFNHAAPAVGLAQALGAGMGIYKDYQQSQEAKASTAQKEQATGEEARQIGIAKNLATQAADPTSQLSQVKRQNAVLGLQALHDTGVIKSPDAQSAFQDSMRMLTQPNPDSGQFLNAMQVDQFSQNSPLLALAEGQQKSDAVRAQAQARVAPQNDKNALGANSQYSNEIQPYESTINSANRVRGIIDKIKNGGLKSTPTLANDLSSATASMFNNGKAATVHGQESNQLSSMEGNTAERYGYVTGKAMDTVSPQQLDQLYKDAGALRDEFAYTHKSMFDSFKQGLPDQFKPAMQHRFDSFRKSSVDSSFSKTENDTEHAKAVKWAQDHPDDPRSAQILKINGVKK